MPVRDKLVFSTAHVMQTQMTQQPTTEVKVTFTSKAGCVKQSIMRLTKQKEMRSDGIRPSSNAPTSTKIELTPGSLPLQPTRSEDARLGVFVEF
jgi:hypothetical protein